MKLGAGPILICFDGSSHAERALDLAAELFAGRRAVVLDVAPAVTVAESFAAVAPAVPTPDFEEANADDALGVARVGADRARESGLDAEARGAVDTPGWDGVVAIAEEIDAAVIVLGSRGLTGARELLHGSFSHAVAEHAGRPVLIVPPPSDRRTQS